MALPDLSASHLAAARKTGGPIATIARLSTPLTAFFLIQSGVNLAVLAMIGRLGPVALAGVGAASAAYGVALAMLFGLDAAVQASVSRTVGAGRGERLAGVLGEALALGLPLGLLLAAGLWLGAPGLMRLLLRDAAAARIGAGWARAAAPSLALLALTIPVNSIWIGSARPGRALAVTAATAPVQIFAAKALMFGIGALPAQGAVGAGAAQSIAALAGLGLQVAMVLGPRGVAGPLRAPIRPEGAARLAALGWPISLQQALQQCGLVVAYAIVGGLGVGAVAIVNVLVSLSMVPIQAGVAVGSAAATLVGQALGRGEVAAARSCGWRAVAFGSAAIAPLGLIAVVAPQALAGLFLHGSAEIAAAAWPMRLAGLAMVADPAGRVLSFAIRGAGATRIGALLPFLSQWAAQLPASFVCAVPLGWGVAGLAGVQLAVALGDALVAAAIWRGDAWTAPRALRPGRT